MLVFLIILIVILSGWVIFLSYYTFSLARHYNQITRGVEGKSLQELLEILVREVKLSRKELTEVAKRLDLVESDGKFHIQKIGLRRFNPFNDTGGDQSFILALVDDNNTGVVISGLYSRAGTRWYAKQVIKGKGAEHELSAEEVKALHLAKKS